jgi:glycosyltransferase involved in cell wall biosynthesis
MNKTGAYKLTVTIPVLNEEENILSLVERLDFFAASCNDFPVCFLFVDDGSSDSSLTLIKEVCDKKNNFFYLKFDFNKIFLYNIYTINKNERYIPMFDKNYFLNQLRNGVSMDDMGQALADAMNAAQEAYTAELEVAKKAQADAEMAQAKRDMALDLIDIIQDYGHLVAPEAANILDDIDDTDIDAMVTTLDEMFHMMTAMAQLKANLEKIQPNKIPVPVKRAKSDDEVLSNFIKSLM